MKHLLLLLSAVLYMSANAQENDFSHSDTEARHVNYEKLRYWLEIRGEILVFDKTGTHLLYEVDEERSWKFGGDKPILANWSYKRKSLPEVALQHEWQMGPDGKLTAKIQQFASLERNGKEIKYGKLVKSKEFMIENFNSLTWVIEQNDSVRVVAKFDPHIWSETEPSDAGALPIASQRMTIYDSKGNLWASRLDTSGGKNIYFGVTTHRGSVYLSYLPFRGAKLIGIAEKSRIKLEDGGTKLFIESNENFLPREMVANVYGYFDFSKKTDSYQSVRSNGSDKEDNFLRHIQ